MNYEVELARSFMKSSGKGKHYHPHIWLSILGIAVGVGFLIFTLSLYDGYVRKIETIIFSFYPQITLQNKSHIDDDLLLLEEKKDNRCNEVCQGKVILEDRTLTNGVTSFKQKFDLENYNRLKQKLMGIKGIKQMNPIIFEEANFTCTYEKGKEEKVSTEPLRILGVSDDGGGFVPEIERTIKDAHLLEALGQENGHSIAFSSQLYEKLFNEVPNPSQKINRKIQLRLKKGESQQERVVELKVVGVFKLGMHKISENMVITSLKTAQMIFSMPHQATFLGITLEDPYKAEQISEEIKSLTIEDNLNIYHWTAVAADMFNSLSFYRWIIIIVLIISILITAFNIYTTLNIMILERKKQIGVLMSMGIKKISLYLTFVFISQMEAIIGTALGVAGGVLLSRFFSDYFNRSLAVFLQIQDTGTMLHIGTTVLILCFVCLICGITAFAATKKGANLEPVDALRSE
jgi:ABC-type lipoprotein release transport system permease subunit